MVGIRQHWYVILLALLFATAMIYLIPGMNQPVNVYDEGIIAYSAVRVMEGQVPYRDFWSIYSPGQFYGLALVFKTFGTTILVERLWDTTMRALISVAAFMLVLQLISSWATKRVALLSAIVAWATITIWVAYYSFSSRFHWVFYGYPVFPAFAFCLFSILCLSIYFENIRARWLVFGGVLLGVAALFRHDFALYAFFGEGLALFLFARLRTAFASTSLNLRDRISLVVRIIAPFVIGVLVIVLPVVIYFVKLTPMNELVYNLFIFPMVSFPRFRSLPFPTWFNLPNSLAFYMPFMVYFVGGAIAFIQLRRFCITYALSILMLVVFGLLSFNQARIRSDLIHTVAFFLPALILISLFLAGISQRERRPMASRVLSSLALLSLVLLVMGPLTDRIALLQNDNLMYPEITHGLKRSQTAIVGKEMAFAVHYIQDRTSPQEKIYVGNSSHDRIFVNEPIIYFLAERGSASRYHELHPGVATTAPVQMEIATDLEKYQVKYLVLSNRFDGMREPNESAISSGVNILDNYIAIHYLPEVRYGPYAIWRRR